MNLECCFSCKHIHSRHSFSLEILSHFNPIYATMDIWHRPILLLTVATVVVLVVAIVVLLLPTAPSHFHCCAFIITSFILYNTYTITIRTHTYINILRSFVRSFVSVSNIYFIGPFKLSKLNFIPECKLLTLR